MGTGSGAGDAVGANEGRFEETAETEGSCPTSVCADPLLLVPVPAAAPPDETPFSSAHGIRVESTLLAAAAARESDCGAGRLSTVDDDKVLSGSADLLAFLPRTCTGENQKLDRTNATIKTFVVSREAINVT